MDISVLIEGVAVVLEVCGVGALVAGGVYAVYRAATGYVHGRGGRLFAAFRQDLGRSILLGLEILIAADIVRTVAIGPTLDAVLALGLIVLVRTFLSFSLEIELEGRLPWQRAAASSAPADDGAGRQA